MLNRSEHGVGPEGGCVADDPLAQLSFELRELLLKRGWNIKQLVSRCSPPGRTVISKAFNASKGRDVPSPDAIVRICRALGADSAPLLKLIRQAQEDRRTPLPGPRAEDRSRQFTREPEEAAGQPPEVAGLFNPLRRENLERAVQWALESAPPVPLISELKPEIDGLYALYYTGPHPLYRPVSSPDCVVPVYVSKARPLGLRLDGSPGGPGILKRRLLQHRRRIDRADDLDAQDFQVRYLPVEEIWMGGSERLMIGDHRPVWNVVVDGFGRNLQGAGRAAYSRRTTWDELHPGDFWVKGQQPAKLTRAELRVAVRQHFARVAEA
ncbi:Eco29kI family restriction endonuclease [Streptomyces hydrogenans]|uniref:Eco29kI family restriction endonuclease n=1 Tax=Streptomyces hydrogenans TaxID=1873719 RepID=UPI0035DA86B6